jgi:ketosteroid isomerase-like protein
MAPGAAAGRTGYCAAVSEENVEIVRNGLEAWISGDYEAAFEIFDENVVTRRVAPSPDPGTWHGAEALGRVVSEWAGMFEDFKIRGEESLDAGDKVVLGVHQEGRARGSNVAVEAKFWFVYTLCEGKVTNFDMYTLREQAFEAAGLDEQGMPDSNVETVRRWFDALSAEDFETAIALMHPEVELVPPGGQPPYRGAESLRRWMEPDALHDQVAELLLCEAAEDGTVLARQHLTARGASSGFELDVVSWSVWNFDQDGLITRGRIFLDREEGEAREAAGLDPA